MSEAALFDVFLSHNSLDKLLVEQIAQRLVDEAKLRPFLDKWHLIPGVAWQAELADALQGSKTVAVFIGPSGNGPWHHEEMQLALNLAVRERNDFRLIPVLLPKADPATVTGFLQLRTWVDFREGVNNDIAFKRLVAGILGKPSDGEFEGITLPDEPAPYRGLMQFKPEHARFFFGREQDTQRLIEKLRTQRFVATVGSSGSGKSSLVGAGVLPRLAQDAIPGSKNWRTVTFTPADDPWRSLAVALASSHPPEKRGAIIAGLLPQFDEPEAGLRHTLETWFADTSEPLLLFVDQFEELFTHAPNARADKVARDKYDERVGRFVWQLAHEVLRPDGRFRVLITLRADFLAHCLRMSKLKGLLQDRQLLLGELATDEAALREVIQRPAQEVGAMLETGLMEVLLADVRRQSGALPLLEHALSELWRKRRGPWLTLAAYKETGGVSGALEQRAEETLQRLMEPQQQIARRIFVKLTSLEEDTENTRRRVDRKALYAETTGSAEVDAVINVLAGPDARLIVADADSLSIAHETLIQNWPKLRTWLAEDRQLERIHRELERATNEWNDHARSKRHLFHATSAKLAETEEHASALSDRTTTLEREFLTACRQERELQRAEEERRLQRELQLATEREAEAEGRAVDARAATQKQRRLTRWAINAAAVAVGLFALAGMIAVYAWWAKDLANQETVRADKTGRDLKEANVVLEESLVESFYNQLYAASKAREQNRFDEALCWHLRAYQTAPPTKEDLKTSARQLIGAWGHSVGRHSPYARTFSPNGETVLGWDTRSAWLWNARTGQPRGEVLKHEDNIHSATFSPDGTVVLVCAGNSARLWDAVTGIHLGEPMKHESNIDIAIFSSDSTTVLTADGDMAHLWDGRTGQPRGEASKHEGKMWRGTFSPDGAVVLTLAENVVRLWDAGTGKPRGEPMKHEKHVDIAVFSSDGTTVLTKDGNTARLWDAHTGQPISEPMTHDEYVNTATFSWNGTSVLTASRDKTARLWDAHTGQPRGEVMKHDDAVNDAAFGPDGETVLTTTKNMVRWWDARTGMPLGASIKLDDKLHESRFSPDGATVLTLSGRERRIGSADSGAIKVARLWDARTGRAVGQPIEHGEYVSAAAFSPDGATLLTTGADTFGWRWDTHTGLRRGAPIDCRVPGTRAQFSHDGATAMTISGYNDYTVRLWDTRTGEPRREPLRHEGHVGAVVFSPDDTTVLTNAGEDRARLWKVQARLLRREDGVEKAVFTPDGQIALAIADKAVGIWDTRTGATRGEPMMHNGTISYAVLSPDGTTLLTASTDMAVRLWDVHTGQPRCEPMKHDIMVAYALFSPDGTTVLLWDSNAMVLGLWDARTGAPLGQSLMHDEKADHALFSPAGETVLTTSGNVARLWDARSGQPRGEPMKHDDKVDYPEFNAGGATVLTTSGNKARLWDAHSSLPLGVPMTNKVKVYALFSPNGKTVLTKGRDDLLRLWDATTGQPRTEPLKQDGYWFSPDGGSVVMRNGDTLRIWDTHTGQPRGAPMKHAGNVYLVKFSPDGKTLLTGGNDTAVKLWDASTGQSRGEPMKHDEHVVYTAFSPDGEIVLTTNGKRAWWWDSRTGQPRRGPVTQTDKVDDPVFRSDGKAVLTTSGNMAQLWDARTGQPCGEPMRHEHYVSTAVFSPDGGTVLTSLGGATFREGTFSNPIATVKMKQLWEVPAPALNDPRRLRLSVEVRTGLYFDERGNLSRLSFDQWTTRRSDLDKLGGFGDVTPRLDETRNTK